MTEMATGTRSDPGDVTASNESFTDASRPPSWNTGLLIASSLLLGGIAVVLWNRQSLRKMRWADAEPEGEFDPAAIRMRPEQIEFFEYQAPAAVETKERG